MSTPSLVVCNKAKPSSLSKFSALWFSYIDELSVYSSRLRDEPATEDEILSMWLNPNIEIFFVSLDKTVIGFLLLGINGNKHENSDWFIGEFYIAKKYQMQGIGKKVIQDLIASKMGAYCLFILRNNIKALRFWDKVFTENGYANTTERFFCGHTPDDCYFRMYEPGEAI